MSFSKNNKAGFVLSALAGLALSMLDPVSAMAGPDRLAALQIPHMAEPMENFDLDALETKLSNTDALTFVAKVKLKIGINSLTEEFGQYHNGKSDNTLGDLEKRFEEFLYRTVGMLQKGDPSLARELAMSRDALWDMLTDPQGDWPSPTEP